MSGVLLSTILFLVVTHFFFPAFLFSFFVFLVCFVGLCDHCWVAQLRDALGKITVLISSCYLLRVVKSVKFVRGVSWADNVILESVNSEQIFCFFKFVFGRNFAL